MSQRLQGLIFAVLGLASLGEAWRITTLVRGTATFDTLGPDGYLAVVGGCLLLVGMAMSISRSGSADTVAQAGRPFRSLPPHVCMLAALTGFALAIPVTGFLPACFAFFLAAFCWISGWSLAWGTAGAILAAALLHLVFERFADVPLPKGLLGL